MLGRNMRVIVQCRKCGRRARAKVFVTAIGMYTGTYCAGAGIGDEGYHFCCGEAMRPIRQHTYHPK